MLNLGDIPADEAVAVLRVAINAAEQPMLLVQGENGDHGREEILLAANPAALFLIGRDGDSLRGTSFSGLAVRSEQVKQALRARRPRLPLCYLNHVSGKHLAVELRMDYVGDNARYTLVSLRDLSAQQEAETEQRDAERFYRGIFGAAPYPLLIVDAQQQIIAANEAASILYGIAAGAGETPRYLHELLVDGTDIGKYLRPGVNGIGPHAQRDAAGAQFIAEASVAFLRRGRASQWLIAVRNITEAHLAAAALRESEERWRFALEGAGDGIWEWNPDSDAFFVSPRFIELLHMKAGQLAGFADWEARVHPDDLALAQRSILAHLTGESDLIEMEVRLRDGREQYRWLALRALGMGRDAQGRTQRVIGTMRMIDAERQRQQEERARARHLLHIDRLASLGEFATLIAHELNQPLAAIGNFASTALRSLESDPTAARRPLELIQFAVQNSATIVRRVRSFAQKETPVAVPVALNAVVGDVLAMVEAELKSLSIHVDLQLDPDLPTFPGDPVSLRQLLLNLAKNAIDAMLDQAEPHLLRIATRVADGQALELAITDSGCGLPSELRETLYQPFFTSKADGVGMGLAICRTIVENHHGQLLAEPQEPQGTRFVARFPLP